MMDACPLCILQRVMFIVMGFLFLLGALHAPRGIGRWIYVAGLLLTALVGAGIAIRHLWIQSLPLDQVPSCGAPLGYLLATRASHGGLMAVLYKVLTGSGECSRVETILGISMPMVVTELVLIAGRLVCPLRFPTQVKKGVSVDNERSEARQVASLQTGHLHLGSSVPLCSNPIMRIRTNWGGLLPDLPSCHRWSLL